MLIDTHCHLHDPEWFTPEQSELFLQEARKDDVQKVICIGTNPQDSGVARDYANAHDDVYWTYGIHPEFASQPEMLVMPELSSFRESPEISNLNSRLVAIGEIGLDYHYDGYDRTAQIRLFEQMLQFAFDLNLPVSLHIREAFSDALAVIDNFPKTRGVVHSFTGSKKDLRQGLERGF